MTLRDVYTAELVAIAHFLRYTRCMPGITWSRAAPSGDEKELLLTLGGVYPELSYYSRYTRRINREYLA